MEICRDLRWMTTQAKAHARVETVAKAAVKKAMPDGDRIWVTYESFGIYIYVHIFEK